MRFYKTRRYLGIKYQQTTLYGASLEEARKSGIKEAWTRTGRPYAICDADEWIELPACPAQAADVFLKVVGEMNFRVTSRVTIESKENVPALFGAGYELITCQVINDLH